MQILIRARKSDQSDRRRRRRLKGIHYRSDTNRTGAEGLSFYYPRLLHCLNQMLAVVLLSQHRVSSSKTVNQSDASDRQCLYMAREQQNFHQCFYFDST